MKELVQSAADTIQLSWNKIEPLEPLYLECACYSPEHTLRITWDEEDNEIYTEVFLNHYRNIFKRMWVAIKYVFGYKCRYGHWDCFIMQPKDAHKVKQLCDKLVQ